MTENRTSQCIAELAKRMGGDFDAVFAKYQKMVWALSAIEANEHSGEDWCEAGECKCHRNYASEALAYDPLSSTSQ